MNTYTKMNCPTCLEPVRVPVPVTTSTLKCSTCNNDIQVDDPPEVIERHEAPKPVTTHSPVPKSVEAPVRRRSTAEPAVVEKKNESKFSFRVFSSVSLLLLFCFAAFLVFGTALTFYLTDFKDQNIVNVRSEFFNALGINGLAEYTTKIAAITMGKALLPGLLALFALIAVSRRSQLTAIAMLTLLVALGFVIGNVAPVVPIVCLILVCIPGRSQVWRTAAA